MFSHVTASSATQSPMVILCAPGGKIVRVAGPECGIWEVQKGPENLSGE